MSVDQPISSSLLSFPLPEVHRDDETIRAFEPTTSILLEILNYIVSKAKVT